MGVGSSKNDDFSNNPRFNLQTHKQAMQNLSGNYVDTGFNVPSSNSRQAEVHKTQFKQIERTCSIYKPSLHIVPLPNKDAFLLEFDYDSRENCLLELYVGVVEVVEDSSNITQSIKSKVVDKRLLQSGKRVRFSNEIPLNGFSGLEASNFILRIISQIANEKTEYSMRKVRQPNQHWKVLLQKLELNGRVTQLQNIYKGDETAQCIICLSTPSNTLISPCNHLCLCQECLESVRKTTNKCPICRTVITNFKVILNSV